MGAEKVKRHKKMNMATKVYAQKKGIAHTSETNDNIDESHRGRESRYVDRFHGQGD